MCALPLDAYAEVAGEDVLDQLRQLADRLQGLRVVHVNSSRTGGVAQIINRLVRLMNDLGIDTSWQVIQVPPDFSPVAKSFRDGIRGFPVDLSTEMLDAYKEVNRKNAERLKDELADADVVVIHDSLPAGLLMEVPKRKGKWVWRCHLDASKPHRPVWKYLREIVQNYDASIFSLASFARQLPHPQFIIPPSIDPLSDKNRALDKDQVARVCDDFNLDPSLPLLLQVSRFDRFKDPVGVIRAYRKVKAQLPVQLVLAGDKATDDPEYAQVLKEVEDATDGDPDIHVLHLPPGADQTINALQRAARIVLQKSSREGFGLSVTEAMWKSKPVIGGDAGGISLQVVNYHTGFLVHSSEGAALRIRYLLNRPDLIVQMGVKAKEFVREHFLLTRHLREYLTLMVALIHEGGERIELK